MGLRFSVAVPYFSAENWICQWYVNHALLSMAAIKLHVRLTRSHHFIEIIPLYFSQ